MRIYPQKESRFEVQKIEDKTANLGYHFRITDTVGDNRISTSYELYHAQLVCDALNERDQRLSKVVDHELENVLWDVIKELARAKAKHGPQKFNSCHEGYAVLLEEVDELKAEVWKSKHDREEMRKEAIQVAAMAVRFVNELT